jgi:hypothetical protein
VRAAVLLVALVTSLVPPLLQSPRLERPVFVFHNAFWQDAIFDAPLIATTEEIFYTAGEIVRREVPGHTTYAEANGFWRSGSFAPFKSILDRAWLPWLEGKASFETTLRALVAALP